MDKERKEQFRKDFAAGVGMKYTPTEKQKSLKERNEARKKRVENRTKRENFKAGAIAASRAKGKRAILRMNKLLENQKDMKPNEKMTVQATIKELQKYLGETYVPREQRIMTAQLQKTINSAVAKVEALNEATKLGYGKKGAKNLFTQNQMNMATKKYDNTWDEAANPSIYSKADIKIFYKATQRIWEGKEGNRNKMIMKYFGVDDLDEAFQIVMNSPQGRYARAIESAGYNQNQLEGLSEEQQEYYKREIALDLDHQDEDSPEYLVYVIQFDPNKKWDKQRDEQ